MKTTIPLGLHNAGDGDDTFCILITLVETLWPPHQITVLFSKLLVPPIHTFSICKLSNRGNDKKKKKLSKATILSHWGPQAKDIISHKRQTVTGIHVLLGPA